MILYGSLLGVFILGILTKRASATGAFWGCWWHGRGAPGGVSDALIEFLWHNLMGTCCGR